MTRKIISDSDKKNWQLVAASIAPLPRKRKSKKPEPTAASAIKPQPPSAEKASQKTSHKTIARHAISGTQLSPTTAKSTALAPNHALERGLQKALRQGDLTIDATLDLHGMSYDRAHDRCRRFILSAHAQGLRNLLIITGKGARAATGGILRTGLQQWVHDAPLRALVMAIKPAHAKDGGDGAFYIRLRRQPLGAL